MGGGAEQSIRDTLGANGWHIYFLGPTDLSCQQDRVHRFRRRPDRADAQQLSPEALELMRHMNERFAIITKLLDGHPMHLPFTVVHARRAD